MQIADERSCALCGVSAGKTPIIDGASTFCCAGCHAVYKILEARQELALFQDSPLFHHAVRAGLITNAQLLETLAKRSQEQGERRKLYLEITDLWCPSCALVIQWIISQMRGVIQCVVDYTTDLACIEFSPFKTSKSEIVREIQALGYHPASLDDRAEESSSSHLLYIRFAVAAFCALNIMMFSYPIYASYFDWDVTGYASLFCWLSFFAALPVMTFCMWPLWRRSLNSVRAGVYGMETLVSIGVVASFGYSSYEVLTGGTHVYFDAMSVIVAFVLFGRLIESRAKVFAKGSLMQLTRLLPRRARRLCPDGSESFVPLKTILPGDHLVVLPGEKVPLEGIVTEGEVSVDESVMTGESTPVIKREGSDVLSGTLVRHGRLVYRVTTTQERSLLQQLISLSAQDLQHKGLYVRAADTVSRWFVPVVVLIALATFAGVIYGDIHDANQGLWETAILRCVAVLLISCPCALGIAAPLAEARLLHSLASAGAIVRNRGCLQFLGRETAFVFDKTGTVTEGRFVVRSGLTDLTPEQQQRVKGLAMQSVHLISAALVEAIELNPVKFDSVQEIAGRGLIGHVDSIQCLLGSSALMEQYGIRLVDVSNTGHSIASTVWFSEEGKAAWPIVLGDSVRKSASLAVSLLDVCYLVSGDAQASVSAVAKECLFTDYRAGYSPLEKRQFIAELRQQGHTVMMVGDGVNDAPALSCAQVGVSMVSATDVSIQVSDILLTSDRLDLLSSIRRQARRAQRIIWQNIGWAFSYNIVGIFLALSGTLTPIFSAVAMVASSLLVLLNTLRLKERL